MTNELMWVYEGLTQYYGHVLAARCGLISQQLTREAFAPFGDVISTVGADSFPINTQTLDDDPVVRNRFHEFVAAKPAWYAIADDAKQFDGHPVQS